MEKDGVFIDTLTFSDKLDIKFTFILYRLLRTRVQLEGAAVKAHSWLSYNYREAESSRQELPWCMLTSPVQHDTVPIRILILALLNPTVHSLNKC